MVLNEINTRSFKAWCYWYLVFVQHLDLTVLIQYVYQIQLNLMFQSMLKANWTDASKKERPIIVVITSKNIIHLTCLKLQPFVEKYLFWKFLFVRDKLQRCTKKDTHFYLHLIILWYSFTVLSWHIRNWTDGGKFNIIFATILIYSKLE